MRWRLQTSWPKSLETTHGGVEQMARRIGEMTEGKFQVSVLAAGEIVPGNQVFDAVANGSIEATHTLSTFFIGKNPAITFETGLPFGLNARQQFAWWRWGGGHELAREVFKPFGIVNFACGNTGVQMGGWYRKEIKGARGPQGPQDAHRRHRRHHPRELGVIAAADPAGRHLRVARDAAPSMRPSSSAATTTRSSASTRSRSTTTRRAGGKAARRSACW